MNLTELEPRLEAAIGLDVGSLGPTIIRRAVERRLEATQTDGWEAYLDLVRRSPEEVQALVEELVVHESWFFRHPQAFSVLSAAARAYLTSGREAPYRVLSIPCAGGEEPYSIAITLLEAGLPPARFLIDAADISQQVLQRARAATFGAHAMRAVNDAIRLRYFKPNGSAWTARPSLQAAIRFAQANILSLSASGLTAGYDAIFCRNLLIYQSEAARVRIIAGLRDALAPDGLLFVGHAEMLPLFEPDFTRLSDRGAFAYRRRTAAAPARPPASKLPKTPLPSSPPPPPIAPVAPESTRTASRRRSPHSDTPESLHSHALALANQRRYDEAIALCEDSLKRYGPRADTFHALGVIHGAADRTDDARQAHERAVYLDPNHADSLLALALIARRAGDTENAQRYEARARRAYQRRPKS